MRKIVSVLGLLTLGAAIQAQEIPEAVRAYDRATQARNIEAYMALFTADMVMIDVGRVFDTLPSIRQWALAEVIPQGPSFHPLEIQAQTQDYYKAKVRWMSWEVLYYFWTADSGKIRKMSLQYQEVGTTDLLPVYKRLPPNVALYFDAVKAESVEMLDECFAASPKLRVVSRSFEGREGIRRFAHSEVFGGKYELLNLVRADEKEVLIHLRFTPRGGSNPEPDALYRFQMEGSSIRSMDLQYK
jgi:hypothetical protein